MSKDDCTTQKKSANAHVSHDRIKPASEIKELQHDAQSEDLSHHDNVIYTLEWFVKYFVKEFEVILIVYNAEINDAKRQENKAEESLAEIMGGAAGGLLGTCIGLPGVQKSMEKAGRMIGKEVDSRLRLKRVKEAIEKKALVNTYLIDNTSCKRSKLVEAGIDIFQSFEMQFMQITSDQGQRNAIQLLAKDAAKRASSYWKSGIDIPISECVILGKSKRRTFSRNKGYRILHTNLAQETQQWNTARLYNKAGIVNKINEDNSMKHYRKKGSTANYGYRRLLLEEKWEKIEDQYELDNNVKMQSTDYKYVLNSKDLKEQIKTKILAIINRTDIEKLLDILRQEIRDVHEDLRKEFDAIYNDLKNSKHLKTSLGEKQFKQQLIEAFQEIEAANRFNQQKSKENIDKQNPNKGQANNNNTNQKTEEGKINDNIKLTDIPQSIWFGIREPISSFTGRNQELDILRKRMQQHVNEESVYSRVSLITGSAGIGKSELARRFVQEIKTNNLFENVVWIKSENEATLTESFTRLADKLQIKIRHRNETRKKAGTLAHEICKYFEEKKCFFVFDNAENQDTLDNFLPGILDFSNYALITSQSHDWNEGITNLNLKPLAAIEAVELITKELKIKNESQNEEINKLNTVLGGFPLAIQHSIACIREEQEKARRKATGEYTLANYLNEYEATEKLFDSNFYHKLSNDYAKTAFASLKIALNKIQTDKLGIPALKIFETLSFLASNDVPIGIFSTLDGCNEALHESVELLNQFSIIRLHDETLDVHELVQQIVRTELGLEQNKNVQTVEDTMEMLQKSFPGGSDNQKDDTEKTQQLPHLEEFFSHMNALLITPVENEEKMADIYLSTIHRLMSNAYSDVGDLEKQKTVLEKALKVEEKRYGENHFITAITLANLASIHSSLGESEEVKKLLERAIEIQKDHYGPEHFVVAATLKNLACAYGNLDEPEKMKTELEDALEIEEKYYGKDHFYVAETLKHLGIAYGKLGNQEQKKTLLKRALKIQEKHYGEEHPQVAKTLESLADAYGRLGEKKEMKPLLEKALQIEERYYGPEHFQVAKTLGTLASVYANLGDLEEKKTLLERALKIEELCYGEDDFRVTQTLKNLGCTYGDLGDTEKKKTLLDRASKNEDSVKASREGKDRAEEKGRNTSNSLSVPETLEKNGLKNDEKPCKTDPPGATTTLKKNGYSEELVMWSEKVLEMKEKESGNGTIDIADKLTELAKELYNLGDPEQMIKLLVRAVKIEKNLHGAEHSRVGEILIFLGAAYRDMGDTQKAIDMNERALEILGNDASAANAQICLGNAYGDLDDHKRKLDLVSLALSSLISQFGETDYRVAKAQVHQANAYRGLKDTKSAKDLLELALSLLEKHYGKEHFEVAKVNVFLSMVYGDLGNHTERMKLLEAASPILESYYGAQHFEVGKTRVQQACAAMALRGPEKAKELLEEALPMLATRGKEHFAVARAQIYLATIYHTLGEHQKRDILLESAIPIFEKHYGKEDSKVAEIRELQNRYRKS